MSSGAPAKPNGFPTWDLGDRKQNFYEMIRNSTRIKVPSKKRSGGIVSIGMAFVNHRPSGNFAPHFTLGNLPDNPVRLPFSVDQSNGSKCTLLVGFNDDNKTSQSYKDAETALKEVFAAALVDGDGLPGYEKTRARILNMCESGQSPYEMVDVTTGTGASTKTVRRMKGPAIEMVNKSWISCLKESEDGLYDPAVKVQFKPENVNPAQESISQTLITSVPKEQIESSIANGGNLSSVRARKVTDGFQSLVNDTHGKACFALSRVWFKTHKNGDIENCGVVVTLHHFCIMIHKNTKDALLESKCRGMIMGMPTLDVDPPTLSESRVSGKKRNRGAFESETDKNVNIHSGTSSTKNVKIVVQDLDSPASGKVMNEPFIDAQSLVN